MQLDNNNLAGSKRLDRTTAADWLEFADLFPPSVDLLTIDDRNMAGSIEKRINGKRDKVRNFWPISSCGPIQSRITVLSVMQHLVYLELALPAGFCRPVPVRGSKEA